MQPLVHGDKKLDWPNSVSLIQVSSTDDSGLATFCGPVGKRNSNHSFNAGMAHCVGLSMVKYAAIARVDAETFMNFARTRYQEKIWDHAAGIIIAEAARGVVTDSGGRLLRRRSPSGNNCLLGVNRTRENH
ncbi:unnamed protein product [Citrullus colocynthis]|uniref:Uncharacterized protein n=1 Tax=Citrullus colocynthis TaxID=252529 RepID=A0ABP0Z053_9ROSI